MMNNYTTNVEQQLTAKLNKARNMSEVLKAVENLYDLDEPLGIAKKILVIVGVKKIIKILDAKPKIKILK